MEHGDVASRTADVEAQFFAPEHQQPQDWHRVAAHLRDAGFEFHPDPPPRQFAGGFGNLNFLLQIDGKRILMVHSTPWEPRGSYVLPTSSELDRFGEADADIVLYGHTHRQVVRRVGRVLVVNPGSAGEARDPSNGRQLSCAVLDTATEEVVVHDFPALPVRRQPERG